MMKFNYRTRRLTVLHDMPFFLFPSIFIFCHFFVAVVSMSFYNHQYKICYVYPIVCVFVQALNVYTHSQCTGSICITYMHMSLYEKSAFIKWLCHQCAFITFNHPKKKIKEAISHQITSHYSQYQLLMMDSLSQSYWSVLTLL